MNLNPINESEPTENIYLNPRNMYMDPTISNENFTEYNRNKFLIESKLKWASKKLTYKNIFPKGWSNINTDYK